MPVPSFWSKMQGILIVAKSSIILNYCKSKRDEKLAYQKIFDSRIIQVILKSAKQLNI